MEPFIGQIQLFSFDFAPRGWAKCDGQLLDVASNTSLFSLLGSTYGGDGRTTFGLPDLRGRMPIHQGQGSGLTNRTLGSKAGVESVVLNVNQLPTHNHGVIASADPGNSGKPENMVLASGSNIFHAASNNTNMASNMISNSGGNQSHENMPPFLTLNWCIAITGLFPSRN